MKAKGNTCDRSSLRALTPQEILCISGGFANDHTDQSISIFKKVSEISLMTLGAATALLYFFWYRPRSLALKALHAEVIQHSFYGMDGRSYQEIMDE